MRAVVLLVLVGAAASCGVKPGSRAAGHPALAASPPDAVAANALPPAPPRVATLSFEVRGRPFPLPLVHGTVAGTPTWMLVDTGANSHVIAGYFARKVGLPLGQHGDIGTD